MDEGLGICLENLESRIYCYGLSQIRFTVKKGTMSTGQQVVASATTQNGNFRLEAIDAEGQKHHALYINECLLATSCPILETLLADLALAGISPGQGHAEVLIGGLGLGVTLRQVLKHSAVRFVCVVEIESRVVDWNRRYLNNADLLDDERVELVLGDFCTYVEGAPRNYNGIAMHIDIGPERVARSENRRAYSLSMLRVLRTRLRAGGALAIRTGQVSASYEKAFRGIFEHVEVFAESDPSNSQPCSIYQVIA